MNADQKNRKMDTVSTSQPLGREKKKKKIQLYYIRIFAILLIAATAVFGIYLLSLTNFGSVISKSSLSINGINLQGMGREEAKLTVMEEMAWNLRVSYLGKEYPVSNLFEQILDKKLDEIYAAEEQKAYVLEVKEIQNYIEREVTYLAALWDVPAKNAGLESYDPTTNKFIIGKEQPGVILDQLALAKDIENVLLAKDYQAIIEAKEVDVSPEFTKEEVEKKYQIIGTFTTKTTKNSDRNENISLASKAINGKIIEKGESFSINEATGERTPEKGYKPAGAYVNGVLVEEPGGGVCQVSSTLYNALIFGGIKTVERHAHSFEPSYVIPGEDAMISYPDLDMIFENNTIDSLGILASLQGTTLTISLYGIPLLEEGVTREMYTELRSKYPEPKPTYIENSSLSYGEQKVKSKGTEGTAYITYLIEKKDGEVISKQELHNSIYKGKAAVIYRNTKAPAPATTSPQVKTSEAFATTDPTKVTQNQNESSSENTVPPTSAVTIDTQAVASQVQPPASSEVAEE
ncbi:hydrolase [Clostridia bacterium]|nr:hydrolase [Clostridia bacterium]